MPTPVDAAVTRMVVMVRPADLAVCSHHFLVVAETKAARAEASVVCSPRSLALATSTVVPVEVSPASSHPSLAADRAVAVCSARVALMRTVLAVLRAIKAPRRKLQAPLPKVTEDISSLATARSRQQASSQAITMRTLQLTSRAMKRLMLINHLSRVTMGPTAILDSSSSSSRTAMAKEVTDSKDTMVDTNTVRVVKVVGTRLNGEREHERRIMRKVLVGEQFDR